uniref:Lipid-binding serum glycoprotein N-terminal domain-containing protein n=2 Tax=Ciona intestinalis TaxID=7719 RepID=H2XKM7_CIOIN
VSKLYVNYINIAVHDLLKTHLTDIKEYLRNVLEIRQSKKGYWLLLGIFIFIVFCGIWVRQGKPTTTAGKFFDAPECIAKILKNTDSLQPKNISLNDISGEWKLPIYGVANVHYALLHLKIYQFVMATATVQLTKFPNAVIRFSIEHGSFMIDGDYGFRHLIIEKSGHFTGEATDIYFDLNLVVSKTNTEQTPVNIQHCTASVYHVSLRTTGE